MKWQQRITIYRHTKDRITVSYYYDYLETARPKLFHSHSALLPSSRSNITP